MDASSYGSAMELLQQQQRVQRQQQQQLSMARYAIAMPPPLQLPYTQQQQQQQLQQHHFHQQQQQHYYYQPQPQQHQYMGHHHTTMNATSPPPTFSHGLRTHAPMADTAHSPPTHCSHSHSPGAWSSATDSSGGLSSPPSDSGGTCSNEWDLLSDMLMDDAVATASAQPPSSLFVLPSAPPQPLGRSASVLSAVVAPVQSLAATVRSSSSSPLRTISSTTIPPTGTGTYATDAVPVAPPVSVPAAGAVKLESVTAEEQKKRRRRTQIASSVQRHREKKKTLVASLKHELAALTSELAAMRTHRNALYANAALVDLEERAVTQRRKRKQAEDVNATLKKALFQQTTFLGGMQQLLAGDAPAPRALEFHDWIHSFTVLSGRDTRARQREYVSYFSASKLDLATNIVMHTTDAPMQHLNRLRPYYARVELLHDGTHAFADEATVPVKYELQRPCFDAGNGQVMKKYTSVFLFDDAGAPFESVHAVAWECTKQVGVFWPGAGYTSRTLDVVDAHVDVGGSSTSIKPDSSITSDTNARVYFTDLAADLALLDDVRDTDATNTKITVESRMLCCEQQRSATESVFVWDYVDRDELYPLPLGADALAQQVITRKSCGAVVVRKEPDGLISVRSTSIKIFDTTLPATSTMNGSNSDTNTMDTEAIAALNRRLGLQATEAERQQQKCIRYVYDAMRDAFAAAASQQQ